jgi:hypothetical protein
MDIGTGLPSDTISLTPLEERKTILSRSYNIFRLSFHKYPGVLIFSDIERLRTLFILKKVKEFLIINLQE